MWTAGVWAALVLSGGIGVTLGLVGGGGSIITVPVLVYVAGLPVREAVALSLAVVGATAAVGAVVQARQGNVHPKAALLYGGAGVVGAALGARLTPLVPPPVLMTVFAALMIWVGLRMARGGPEGEVSRKAECVAWKCLLAGFGVGVVTGFLGVGGGFLIVPALLRFAKMPMAPAVGTSLAVIAANSLSGFAAHAGELSAGAGALAAALTAASVAGIFVGMALGKRMKPGGLKKAFGGLSLAVAGYLIVMNVRPLLALITGG